jgi:hypothetical protein
MMIQNIFTGVTILVAAAYMAFKLFRLIVPAKDAVPQRCVGCPGCSLNPKLIRKPPVSRRFVTGNFFA